MGGHEDASGDAQAEHDSPFYQKPVAESQAALCVARLPMPFQELLCTTVASEQLHYALELSGLFDLAVAMAVSMCRRMSAAGVWLLFSMIGACPAFSTQRRPWCSASRWRAMLRGPSIPYRSALSYITIMTDCCTLIGTLTNLLVDDVARVAGQLQFGIFENTQSDPTGTRWGALSIRLW